MEENLSSTNETQLALDILKTLHGSTVSRWMNRRDQEWKLSYSFWTALAGLAAAIFFGKDVRLPTPSLWVVALWLMTALAFHAYYLLQMTSRILQDAQNQCSIETRMASLSLQTVDIPCWNTRQGMGRYYGFVAQMGISLLLSSAVFWITANMKPSAPVPITAVPTSASVRLNH